MAALDLLLTIPRKGVTDSLVAFHSNSGAIDMVAKVWYYGLQVVPIMLSGGGRGNPVSARVCTVANDLVKSLLNLRMLINLQRYPYTVRLLFRALEGNAGGHLPAPLYAMSVLMLALRVAEQTTGDFIYWHTMFPELRAISTASSLQWRYKFFKCWANIFTVVVELAKLWRCRNKERHLRAQFRAPLTLAGGVRVCETESEQQQRQRRIIEDIRSVRREREGSIVALLCSFLEVWVYLRYAAWFRPPALLPPLCGALSSCIGTYFLWRRTTEIEPSSQKAEKS